MTALPRDPEADFQCADCGREPSRLRTVGGASGTLYVSEVNPAGDVDHPWDWFLRRDIAALVEVDAIVVLPGWEASKGAALETFIGKALGMDVLELEEALRPRRLVCDPECPEPRSLH